MHHHSCEGLLIEGMVLVQLSDGECQLLEFPYLNNLIMTATMETTLPELLEARLKGVHDIFQFRVVDLLGDTLARA